MKNLRKILPVALMAMTLCSCGGGVDVTNKHLPTDDPENPVEVVFWHCMGHDKSENLRKIVKKFNEENPKYHVTETAPEKSYGDLHNTVMTRIASGEVPALCMGYPDSFSMYMTKYIENSHIYKLDNFFNDETYGYTAAQKEDFVDAFLDEGRHFQFDGIWSVPMYKSTEIMYYNANWFAGDNTETSEYVTRKGAELDPTLLQNYHDALDALAGAAAYATDEQLAAMKAATEAIGGYTYEVPQTWEQLIALSRTILANRATEKLVNPNFYAFGYDSDANLLISQMAQLGIPYTVNDDASKHNTDKHFAFNNADAKGLVRELVQLKADKVMVTKGTYGGKYTNEAFTAYETVMSIGSTGGSSYNVSGNFKVKLAPVPYRSTKPEWLSKAPERFEPKYIQQGPSICFFDNGNDYIHKGAWLFYKYLADPENNAALALENSYDPVRDSSFQTANYASWISKHNLDLKYDIPYTTAQIRQYYMTSEVFRGSSQARDEMDDLLKNIIVVGQSVDEAFSGAYNRSCKAAK